ncbi:MULTISPECIES: MurR/RpiR family transcriptional regulator [Lactococcus]|uniref:MurR/RpiR family transcriptional regulator n=1 Tax=Lactococcus TaxID=1357 RepID=UPI001CDD0FA5|nr:MULTISPECIES: MurR/RpiR family transcriptional regulator [Lactococcus]MCA2390605.1 MurR/RpiR family transcriptional regulator [Lactococcus sp. NH2-7C]MCI1071536.1 MurR/RpiR family transcriptional regulator [Lactococcus lactis]MCT1193782.1 MurR/RpiR family transcriptional regulator [Lactococcus lactis]WGV29815.1 MurR/RpiR family transcriptional regulator [Lactococcus sp. NH2-7C]
MMFLPEQISKLNELETLVFDFIIKSPEEVQQMTIRDLASQAHVSTSTIVRLCTKLGFEGWSDLKFYLKNQLKEKTPEEQHYDNMLEFNMFLRRMNTDNYQAKLNNAAQMIAKADYTVFLGLGTSGSLSEYATKYFVNTGLRSFVISDPFQAVQVQGMGNVVAVIMSVSGETEQVVNKELEFKAGGAKIISITNHEDCTVAKLADYQLSYNLVNEWSKQYPLGNLTTQLPVLAILEILAHKSIDYYLKK